MFVLLIVVALIVVAIFAWSQRANPADRISFNQVNDESAFEKNSSFDDEVRTQQHYEGEVRRINRSDVGLSLVSTTQLALIGLFPAEFVVIDLETTGLNPERDEIIEVGAIHVNLTSDRHATFQSLIKTQRPLPSSITRLTGITSRMLEQHGLDSRDVFEEFIKFIGNLPLVAYNASFDVKFIQKAAMRHGMVIGNSYACALRQAQRAWPDFQNHRLLELSKRLSLPQMNHHRALGDSIRAAHVFTKATFKIGSKVRWTKPVSGAKHSVFGSRM